MQKKQNEDLYIYRIISGITPIRISGKRFLVYPSSSLDKLRAEEIYYDTLEEMTYKELMSFDDIIKMMKEKGLWSDTEEKELNNIPKILDECKVGLFNSFFRAKQRENYRKRIKLIKDRFVELINKRNALFHISSDYIASLSRSQYLIGVSLRDSAGNRVFVDDSFMEVSSHIIDLSLSAFREQQLDSEFIRKLSRSELWHSIWNASKCDNSLFGVPAINYTEDQRNIIMWSKLYDSISENPEAPSSEYYSDDDFIDGWLIVQNDKYKQEKSKSHGDNIFDKHKNKNGRQELFIPIDNDEDFKRVEAMNDTEARMIKKQRMQLLSQKGRVSEEKMIDSQLEMRQIARQQMKGK